MVLFAQTEILKNLPTSDQIANYNQIQFLQVGVYIAGLCIGAIVAYLIRKQNESQKVLFDKWVEQFDKQDARYEKQNERYELLDQRHQARDDKTLDILRLGLSEMSKELARAVNDRRDS